MKVLGIYGMARGAGNQRLESFKGSDSEIKHDGEIIADIRDPKGLFNVSNETNQKVGTAIVLTPTDPEFKDLKILVKDGSILKSPNFKVVVDKKKFYDSNLSFEGHVYGSIGATNYPVEMKKAYKDFFAKGMYSAVLNEFNPNAGDLNDDYNFFVPTDGDGSRFKDYTNLQGGICKPAAFLPATLNEEPMQLIHATLTNFAKTGKLEENPEFINVDKARGSSYAFLEGLKSGKIPTDKPLVFCWGDNFSDIDVKKLMKYHERKGAGLTVLGIPASHDRMKALGAIYLDSKKGLEIQGLKEKPQKNEEIEKSAIPGREGEYLASVGPYVMSKEVLKWLKSEYSKDPSAFQNEKDEYDFSGKILTPMVQILKEGEEIIDENGEKLPMMAYIKPEDETWSDLGKTSDLLSEMRAVTMGAYKGLPDEVKYSIGKNVDLECGVVSTDPKARKLFHDFCQKYDINISNAKIVVSTLSAA